MDWNLAEPAAAPRMRAPEDGIVSSSRRQGWLATRWTEILDQVENAQASRLTRGRTYARGGRVRDLWLSPGQARAEVVGSQAHDVRISVNTFADRHWKAIVETLAEDLAHVAALLEGELPGALAQALDARGLPLVPRWSDLAASCDCQDFEVPCAHVVALHHVIADAIEGDPFTLLELRGRARDQVLAALRLVWGDPEPMHDDGVLTEEDPPAHDWFTSPVPLPALRFEPREPTIAAAGLRALGPPPGGDELERALAPLYEAGGEAAVRLAHREPPEEDMPPRGVEVPTGAHTASADVPQAPAPEDDDASDDAGPADLTELLVDVLADLENAKSRELADRLGVSVPEVRAELVELERLGIVYRTGQTRGTRWWLG